MTPHKIRELARVYAAAEAVILPKIKKRGWHKVDELYELIDPELAKAYHAATPSYIGKGPERNGILVATYRRLIVSHVLDDLKERGLCTQHEDGRVASGKRTQN